MSTPAQATSNTWAMGAPSRPSARCGFELALFKEEAADAALRNGLVIREDSSVATRVGARIVFAIPLGPSPSLFPKLVFAIHHKRAEVWRGLRAW